MQSMFTGLEKTQVMKFKLAQDAAARVFEPDEKLVNVFAGEYDAEDANAVMCLTDWRIIIGWSKRGAPGSITVRYSNIDEVQSGLGWSGGWLTLQHGSHAYKIEKSMSGDSKAREIANLIRQKADETRAANSVSIPAVQQSSGMDELAKAAELHQAGVLNDEEFAAVKARVLGS